jgi:hypothetical protein
VIGDWVIGRDWAIWRLGDLEIGDVEIDDVEIGDVEIG